MLKAQHISVLCLPNLQGEHHVIDLENIHLDRLTIADTLHQQVEQLKLKYNSHQLLLGTSFGALAVWKFASEHHPRELNGIVLIDVLPRLELFPRWRRFALSMVPRLPPSLGQLLYHQYLRVSNKAMSGDLQQVCRRIESIFNLFPQPVFPVPTLVLSSNPTFHNRWLDQARTKQQLTVQMKVNPDKQLAIWLESLSPIADLHHS